MKWILIVMILWQNQPVKVYAIEASDREACEEAMWMEERKLLKYAVKSQHGGYMLTCRERESE